ncbi:hypothetical protein KSW81_003060 [Nannochloris sp. 'desiccata']|nr:hypothetical protein KSW81_003060 [Chlorella desiccata (nom. nud.)]
MRAMLDQLMGSDRNLSNQEKEKVKPKKRKFTDSDVCKYFLCGFCPYEEFRRTKNDLGECPSVHDEACKIEWESLDEKDKEYYGYERDLLRKLERLLSDLRRRIDSNTRRLEATQKPSYDDIDTIENINRQINDLLGKAGDLGEQGDIDAAEVVMKEADVLKEKKVFIGKKFEAKAGNNIARGLVQSVCPISGLIINDEETRLRDHHAGRNYNAWKKLHEMHAMLRDLMSKRSGGGGGRRSRGDSPSGRRGGGGSDYEDRRGRDRRKSRRDRDRSRSRSRSRDTRRRRSRSRSKSRSRSRSRDRYRDRKSSYRSGGRSKDVEDKEKYTAAATGGGGGLSTSGKKDQGEKKEEERHRSPEEGEFKEKGVLTPEEFVLAGDYLVQTCPTWSWEGGDAIPCLQRASAYLNYAEYASPSATGEDVEGGDWIATTSAADVEEELDSFEELPSIQHTSGVVSGDGSGGGTRTGGGLASNQYTIPDIDDDDEERQAKLRQTAQSGGDVGEKVGGIIKPEEEERIPDISDLDLNANQDEDDDAVAPLQPATTTTTATAAAPSGVLACRTYDLLISYDNYYHVPRFWLIGYSENRTPLTQNEVLEDVMSDYFSHKERKTVSVEPHPHRSLGGKVVSIHPCRHAETMHRLAARISGYGDSKEAVTGGEGQEKEEGNNLDSRGDVGSSSASIKTVNEFKIEHYMVLFLKFISSVVPTIEYDYTMPAGM